MIITLTGNLLAERTFNCDTWKAGKTQRARTESFQVGGKGVNVSKMLKRIGESTTAWCFPGGASGQECEQWLRDQNIPFRAFMSEVPTRTGLVVREETGKETTFLGPDRIPGKDALAACAQALDQGLSPAARLAFCGSFPGWSEAACAPLRDAVAKWAQADALDVDTYGVPLRWMLDLPVSVIKINRDEFGGLFTDSEKTLPIENHISIALGRWSAKAWVITDGANDVYVGSRGRSMARLTPPAVKEVSATGSGDVLFACLLHALRTLKKPLVEAVEFALPYGSANAAHRGVAEFDLNNLPTARSFQP